MYLDNKNKRKYHRDWYKNRIVKLKELLGNACEFCGYNKVIEILEFAHKHTEEKSFTVAARIGINWKDVLIEISKCYLLCPNCHRIYDLYIGEQRRKDKSLSSNGKDI